MKQFIYIEFYDDRWHLKGLCEQPIIDHAKIEYGDKWKECLCAKNEKIVTVDELKKEHSKLYDQFSVHHV
ncbi:MAG: hypothetical protein ABIP68_02750 [Ferruginibacter sp.]